MKERSTSSLRRAARLASLPTAHVARAAMGLGRRVGGRPAELVAADVQRRSAEHLFTVLGEMKGGAMKVAQAVSAMEAGLPPELAGPYREALVRLQEAAPPLPTNVVDAVMADALGSRWRNRFHRFDDEPVAAASIGQVHHARFEDGSEVAVKIQYPGVADALAADLRQLDKLKPIVRLGAPNLDAGLLFAVLQDRLLEEVDYRREAEAQQAFADALRGDGDLFVPDVVETHQRVLISRWVDGTRLADVIAHGDAAERNRAGLLLLRLFLSSPERVGRVHGDPHPGNFRLLADGRLGVLDFGSSEPMPNGWPASLGDLLRAGRDGREAELLAIAERTGLVGRGEVTARDLFAVACPYLDPLRVERFEFSRAWLQIQVRRSSDPVGRQAKVQRKLSPNVEHLLVQRVAIGLTGVLCSLEAAIGVRHEVARWVSNFG